MIAVRKGNRALIDAIVAQFRDTPQTPCRALASFDAAEWRQTEAWLDTSGLALYFLDRARTRGFAGAIDPEMRLILEQKLADNRHRTAGFLEEFVAINREFLRAGVVYANVKGVTLSPYSTPDPALRYQSDFDFLVDPAHLPRCRELLEGRGYAVAGTTWRTLEMKTAGEPRVTLDGCYKMKRRRAVELHMALENSEPVRGLQVRDERLDRLAEYPCGLERFPMLGEADQLIGQALHLLGHLRHEHTRPSWLLEFRHHVLARRTDAAFWRQVRELAARTKDAPVALGLCVWLATDLFGAFSTPELDSWSFDALPPKVAAWARRYGRRAVLADVPGTKLYLLLEDALGEGRETQSAAPKRRSLVPMRLPPRILPRPPRETLGQRLRRERIQLEFILYRFRFHLVQGAVYALERWRWKRLWGRRGGEEQRPIARDRAQPPHWCETPQDSPEMQ